MSCSIKRFKCDTNPEKIINNENVKKLNNDLEKLIAERSKLDHKYFPSIYTADPIKLQTHNLLNEKSKKD